MILKPLPIQAFLRINNALLVLKLLPTDSEATSPSSFEKGDCVNILATLRSKSLLTSAYVVLLSIFNTIDDYYNF